MMLLKKNCTIFFFFLMYDLKKMYDVIKIMLNVISKTETAQKVQEGIELRDH